MARRDWAGEQTGMTGASSATVFFPLSSFLLLTFTTSFVANYSNRRGWAWWGGAGQDKAGRDRAGQGGGRRREEGGLAGNTVTAEAEARKEASGNSEGVFCHGGGRRG